MKKILIINQHFLTGGIKKSLENFLCLVKNKYLVKVVFLCGSTDEFDNKYPDIVMSSPFILSSALSSIEELKKMNFFYIRVFIKIIFYLLEKIWGGEKCTKMAVKMARNLGEYDYVISYSHDNWFENGTYFGGGNQLALEKAKAKKKISWIHGEPHAIGLNKKRVLEIYSKFDEIITVSDACKKEFESLSEGEISCRRIYNLFNIDDILNKAAGTVYQKKEKFRIVTVGRLSKVAKRIDKVNEIAKLLKENGYDILWTVVGDGSEYVSCVNKCKEYGLENVVQYVGNQNNPYTYMKESDLLVIVSDTESMSIVLNEALIVGTPVITTCFPAAYESVVDGKNGFVVEKDVYSLYEKIAYCIDNPQVLLDCRKYIIENPVTNEETIKSIMKLLDS